MSSLIEHIERDLRARATVIHDARNQPIPLPNDRETYMTGAEQEGAGGGE